MHSFASHPRPPQRVKEEFWLSYRLCVMKPAVGEPSLRTAGSCNRDIFLSLWSLKVKTKTLYLRKQKQGDTKAHEESISSLSPGPSRLVPIRIHAPFGTHPAFSRLPGLRAHLQGSQMPTQGSG